MKYIIHKKSGLVTFLLNQVRGEKCVIEFNFLSFFLFKLEMYLADKKLFFPAIFSHFFFYSKLKKIKNGDIVILWGFNELRYLEHICALIPNETKKYLWQWNPYDVIYPEKTYDKINQIKNKGFIITTFDQSDAARYGLIYKGQIFCYVDRQISQTEKFDFYYLGASKDRKDTISVVQKMLDKFNTKFIVVEGANDFITYEENLTNIFNSKCIIDITQSKQKGLTLRPLEALFCKKKLFTNNVDIINYDFYRKENVFIWGVDDPSTLDDFLVIPFAEVPREIIDKYDINSWFDSFI